MERRRRIFAILMLAVFLPSFAVSVLHRHPEIPISDTQCAQCVHHHPHQGHLRAFDGGISDCVLCHFLGLPFVATIAAAVLTPAKRPVSIYILCNRFSEAPFLSHNRSRAPPVFSLV